MKKLPKIIAVLLGIAGAIVGTLFYLDNQQAVSVSFLGQPVAELQLALWLLLFFATGCLCGWLLTSVQNLKYRYQLRGVQKSSVKEQDLALSGAPLLNS